VDPGAQAVGSRAAARAEDHRPVVHVAGQDRLGILGRRVEVDEFDRGADGGDLAVGADVDRELRLEQRRRPSLEGDRRAGCDEAAVGQEADERRADAEPLHRGGRAEADLPAERPLTRLEPAPTQLEQVLVAMRDGVAHGTS
jgi:hypothetical protein